jgi:hypothetical protein
MRTALQDRPGGRPAKPLDPEKERLREELENLEKDRRLLEGRLRIQEAIRQTLDRMDAEAPPPKKKRPV